MVVQNKLEQSDSDTAYSKTQPIASSPCRAASKGFVDLQQWAILKLLARVFSKLKYSVKLNLPEKVMVSCNRTSGVLHLQASMWGFFQQFFSLDQFLVGVGHCWCDFKLNYNETSVQTIYCI